VKFSRPDSFNDPWDCRVHYRVPATPLERQRLITWFADSHRKQLPHIAESDRMRLAKDFMATPAKIDARIIQMEQQMYAAIAKMYRVYCLSELCDSQLMWAHYSDSHKGICLEFDGLAAPFTRHDGANPVQYCTTYPALDVVTSSYEALVTKSHVWAYEAEWRLVAEERGTAQAPETLKTDNDFYIFPPNVLKSIIVGCLASTESRQLVARLVRDHAPEVLVRQATVARDSYDLVIVPPVS
jgi:hypothetical protein